MNDDDRTEPGPDRELAYGAASGSEMYRTCSECRRDLEPEPFDAGDGLRVGFSCPRHGLQSVVDPFEDSR